uniref:DDE Tnp4 domain-containing protein n=1 Tax=Sinocyclocheilus grahami TaxID=75366 RepID=A0A672P1W6_SINGR
SLDNHCAKRGCFSNEALNELLNKYFHYISTDEFTTLSLIHFICKASLLQCIVKSATNKFDFDLISFGPMPDYVPSIFAHKNTTDGSQKLERYQRSQRRSSVVEPMDSPSLEVTQADPEEGCTAVGTDLSMADIDQLQNENTKMASLEKKLESQEKQLQVHMFVSLSDFILNDDKHTHFYTGLPSISVFFTLLTYLTSIWNASSTILTLPEQFLVVLMKLRLGLTHQDLAFRFKVSCGTVSNIFHEWLDVMAKELQCLVQWPSRKEIRRNLPTLFKTTGFQKVRCIIDCTEVFTERPTSLQARAITYSHYKSHNTVKFLVFWGGRASDKIITKNSGLIDLLEQGDHVMADRGFNFPEYFANKCVRLHVPASTKGRKQLTGLEVTHSRKMSRVRIHVERAIGKLKSFRILRNTLPVSMVKRRNDNSLWTIDKILIVCAALSYLGKPLVPKINRSEPQLNLIQDNFFFITYFKMSKTCIIIFVVLHLYQNVSHGL